MKRVHFSTERGEGLYFVSPLLEGEGLLHAFLGRKGGVSLPPFDSLNLSLGVGDGHERVEENFRIVEEVFGIPRSRLVLPEQIHSSRVEIVTTPEGGYTCDGLVTSRKGVASGVLTADCTPVLLAGEGGAAVVHAGWRGALSGVVENTVNILSSSLCIGPERVRAAIGPAICKRCLIFEKGLPHRFAHLLLDEDAPSVGMGEGGAISMDLPGLVRGRLLRSGLAPSNIDLLDLCPSCHPELLFSHRRSRGMTGRQLSFILFEGSE